MFNISFDTSDCINDVIDEYADMVYKLAYSNMKNKSDAEDVFQDVFLKYIRKKPHFYDEEHAKAWFIRVTINCCKDIWKSSWNRRIQPLDDNVLSIVKSEVEEENILEEFLSQLSPKYHTVIHLFYYEDMSISEISKALKRNESTVRMQLTRARRMLKEFIERGEKYV